jgi:hypothetical protein
MKVRLILTACNFDKYESTTKLSSIFKKGLKYSECGGIR